MDNKKSFAFGFLSGMIIPVVIIGFVAVVAIIAGVVLYQRNKAETTNYGNNSTPITKSSPADKMKTAPPGAQPAWTKGAPNATITLEEFADFECPSCAYFQPTLKEIKTVYGDRVRIVFRQYPLQMHPKAYDAARAAEAAGMQGKFWEMHDILYEKQKDWSKSADHRTDFENYAKSLGLNTEKFRTDMVGMPASNRVSLDKQRGDYVGIRATPSIFLNGRLLTADEMQTAKLREAIENVLAGR